MTKTDELERKIKESGRKKSWIAKELDISIQSLRSKIINKQEFNQSEIAKLCKLLGITSEKQMAEIFFSL